MINVIKKIDAVFDFISKICFAIVALLIILATLMITASVINRSFIGHIWLFVEEYATLALIPISYLVFGYVLRQNRHLNLDILFNKMPYKVQICLSIFAGLFTLVVCFFMFKYSLSYMNYQIENQVVYKGAMHTPLWGFSLAIVVSMILFGIDLILFIVNRIIQLVTDEQPLKFDQKIEKDGVSVDKELELAASSFGIELNTEDDRKEEGDGI